MKISLNWLRDYMDLPEGTDDIMNLLTQSGLEVGGVKRFDPMDGRLDGLVIGRVMSCQQHPNADQLKITKIDIGGASNLSIVCGAPNVQEGQKVVVALVGTSISLPEGKQMKIKKSKIRGELSEGMLCAEDEIGMGDGHDGIIVLNTDLPCGASVAQYYDRPLDVVLDIDLTPNRGDACSHVGIARELKALLERPICLPSVEDLRVAEVSLPMCVEVLDSLDCPRYTGVVLSGVSVGPSPTWLIDRLRAVGANPVNNVVDATNFVMHELGQPLHAYDYERIDGHKITVGKLSQGTPFVTLDGVERTLSGSELMVCDAMGGIGMAGVFGGERTGVHAGTHSVFLESAYFTPGTVRATAKRHALQTDASFRYERGTDPDAVLYALQRACSLIQRIAGGGIASDFIDIYPEKILPARIEVRYGRIQQLLGCSIPQSTVHKILHHLEIMIEDDTSASFTAIVPPYRVDVKREVDIIEEIGRIYGYDRIVAKDELGSTYMAHEGSVSHQLRDEVAALLVANEYHEICTNSLTRSSYAKMLVDADANRGVSIVNPLSESLAVLRQHMLFSGLEVVAHNMNRRQKDLRLFEFGKIYHQQEGDYVESNRLGVWLTGNQSIGWQDGAKEGTFYDLKGVVYKILRRLGIVDVTTEAFQDRMYQSGIRIWKGQQLLLTAGCISQMVLQEMQISQPLFFADIHWDNVCSLRQLPGHYQSLSKFPSVKRDVSLVLDESIDFEKVREVIRRQNDRLIQDVTVFDVYRDKKLGASKKAYALSFILQGKDKTLDEKSIERSMKRLFRSFEEKLGAVIRE